MVTRMIVTCVRVIVLPSFMSLSCERTDSGRMEVMATHGWPVHMGEFLWLQNNADMVGDVLLPRDQNNAFC